MEDGAVDTGAVELQTGQFDDILSSHAVVPAAIEISQSTTAAVSSRPTSSRAIPPQGKEAGHPSFDDEAKPGEEVQQYFKQYRVSSQAIQALHEMGVMSPSDLMYLQGSDLKNLSLVDQRKIAHLRDDHVGGKTSSKLALSHTESALPVRQIPAVRNITISQWAENEGCADADFDACEQDAGQKEGESSVGLV